MEGLPYFPTDGYRQSFMDMNNHFCREFRTACRPLDDAVQVQPTGQMGRIEPEAMRTGLQPAISCV